jgi:hypothetical protein
MKIDQMKGSRRAILLAALIGFEKATKDAGNKCEKAFLPDMESGTQLGRIAAAKEVLPVPDDVAREWEASEPLVFMYRNALVVHARAVDRVKESEKKLEISTSDSDELLEELQEILRALGDQRDLFAVLDMERNGEAVEKTDPRQLEIEPADGDPAKKESFADQLRKGRARIPRADKPKRPVD